jgi:hypothetical protein
MYFSGKNKSIRLKNEIRKCTRKYKEEPWRVKVTEKEKKYSKEPTSVDKNGEGVGVEPNHSTAKKPGPL